MEHTEIEKLVIMAKTYDNGAIEKLYNAFMPFIISLTNKVFIPGMDKEDMKHECFLSLITAIEKYKGNKTFVAYATQTMKNNLYYQLRLSTKAKNVSIDSLPLCGVGAIDDEIIKKLYLDNLNTLIKTLTPIEQRILTAYYLNDLSLMTISNQENLKYITVAKKKDRALAKMKKTLAVDDF